MLSAKSARARRSRTVLSKALVSNAQNYLGPASQAQAKQTPRWEGL